MASQRSDNLLAEFCGLRFLLLVAVIMVLLAVVILLIPGQSLATTWESLGMLAMFLQWLGMICLAVLCLLSPLLRNLSMPVSSVIIFVVIQLVTLSMSEIAYQLTVNYEVLAYLKPAQHEEFLLHNVLISIIISGVALRYMYLQKQLQLRTTAENQARIQALQARIRPHFLFNSMNTIAALTQVDADAAEKAVLDLSEIYRAILNADDTMTTLRDEVSLTRYYLEIEKLRLGGRLQVNWKIDDELMDTRIPGLVIQPLVENAVYHGIEPRTDGGAVNITINRDEKIHIRISNPLPSRDDHTLRRGNRVAIRNICERLQLAFGGRATLESSQNEYEYEVAMTLPAVKS